MAFPPLKVFAQRFESHNDPILVDLTALLYDTTHATKIANRMAYRAMPIGVGLTLFSEPRSTRWPICMTASPQSKDQPRVTDLLICGEQ